MLTRILVLAALVLAVSVPAALADNGAPPAPGSSAAGQTPAVAGARADRAAQLQQRLEQLRQRLADATGAFAKHCTSGHVDTAKCTEAAKKMLAVLQKIDGRIGDFVGKIHQRCDGPTQQAVPKACAHAQQLVQILQTVQGKLKQLEQKLQSWLANPPAPTAGGGNSAGSAGSAGSSGSSAGSGDGLESLDQLAADLAAARDAASASGL